jgi:hypothetical protein
MEGQAVPGLFHFTLVAAENALRIGLNVLRDAPAIRIRYRIAPMPFA